MAFTPLSGTQPTKGPTPGFVPFSATAAPAPQPTPIDNTLWGTIKNTITGLPAAAATVAKTIVQPAIDQWNGGQQQIDQAFIDQGSGQTSLLQKQSQGLSAASGIGAKLTAPLAPLFKPLGLAVDAYINSPIVQNVINNPEYQKFALSPAGETASKTAENISNATNVAMIALGGVEGIKALAEGRIAKNTVQNVKTGNESISTGDNMHTGSDFVPPTESPVTPKTSEIFTPIDNTTSEPVAPQEQPITSAAPTPTATPEITATAKQLSDTFMKGGMSEIGLRDAISKAVPSIDPGIVEDIASHATALRQEGAAPQPMLETRLKEAVSNSTKDTPTGIEPSTKTPSPTTESLGVSKIGKSIETKAVEAKLTQGFENTAGYDKITIKDQAEKATNLINTSLDDARAIIRGDKPLPDGLRGTALITAMEEHIKANPNGELAYELANSPIVSATSAAAQEMRLAAERVPDSITARFQEIKAAREAALEKRGGAKKQTKKVTNDIHKEITRTASKRQTWEEFTKSLTCQI